MKMLIPLASALWLLLPAGGALAYDIDDLIADARAYHEKFQSEIKDLTFKVEGSMTVPGSGEMKTTNVHYQKGDMWRDEGGTAMEGVEGMPPGAGNLSTVTIFDGEDYWVLAMGMKTKMSKEQMAIQQSSSPIFWQEPVAGSKLLRDENMNGHECWVIQGPENPMMKTAPVTWVDKKLFVFVRSEVELSGTIVRTDFSDFRKVAGDYRLPYHYEVSSGGKKSMEGKITELATNTGLSDSLFDAEKLDADQPDMMDLDMDALIKQAEEMKKKKAEEMQKQFVGDK